MFQIDTFDKTKLLLTRGDDGYVELPIYQKIKDVSVPEKYRLVKYQVQEHDVVTIQVRTEPVVNQSTSSDNSLLFQGIVEIERGIPVWHITHEQSTVDCNTYYWDVQLEMSNGLITTYNSGLLEIIPEVTV